jgi:hypothetical protein
MDTNDTNEPDVDPVIGKILPEGVYRREDGLLYNKRTERRAYLTWTDKPNNRAARRRFKHSREKEVEREIKGVR